MKTIATTAVIALTLFSFVGSSLASAETGDPCSDKNSNMETRECCAKEQARVNLEADSLANQIAADFRKGAQYPAMVGVVADLLRKTASAVTQSQKTWKAYRDQRCRAVEYAWTTGSGAGTAYETCMFELGRARLRELRSAFDSSLH
jgi:uncharacterized protein YecT (DUF1311 family)